jgi:exopolysaccharide biosynthesis protein
MLNTAMLGLANTTSCRAPGFQGIQQQDTNKIRQEQASSQAEPKQVAGTGGT